MVDIAKLPMSLPEREDLAALERVVEKGLNTFTEVGLALMSIRDRHLYRGTHKTFEDYCRDRWMMTRHYANRLIQAHSVVVNLVPTGTKPPANERQARALAGLDPDDAAEALTEARETAAEEGRSVTAADIEEAAREAGIDPATLTRPPPDQRLKALARIATSIRDIRREMGRLDAGEQEAVERWLNQAPDFLPE
jgi:hypothetical protein